LDLPEFNLDDEILRRFAEIIVKWNKKCYFGNLKQNSQHFVRELIHQGILNKTNKEMEEMTEQDLLKQENKNIKLFKEQMNTYKSILNDLKRSDYSVASIYGEKYKSIETHADLDYYFAMKTAKGNLDSFNEEEILLKTADRTFWLQYYHVQDYLKVVYDEIGWVNGFNTTKNYYFDDDIKELCLEMNKLSKFAQKHIDDKLLGNLMREYDDWKEKLVPNSQSTTKKKDSLIIKLNETLSDYKTKLETLKTEKEKLKISKEPLTKNQLFKRFFMDCLNEKKVKETEMIPELEKLLEEFDKSEIEMEFVSNFKDNFTDEVIELFNKILVSKTSEMCCHYKDPIDTKSFLPQFYPTKKE
jgi:hypothetical protein